MKDNLPLGAEQDSLAPWKEKTYTFNVEAHTMIQHSGVKQTVVYHFEDEVTVPNLAGTREEEMELYESAVEQAKETLAKAELFEGYNTSDFLFTITDMKG